MSERGTYYGDVPTFLLPTLVNYEIAEQMLPRAGTTILVPESRAFATPAEDDQTLEVRLSGAGATLVSAVDGGERRAAAGAAGYPVALLRKDITGDGYAERTAAFIIGSSPALLDEGVWSVTDNQTFIMRVTDALFGHDATDAGIDPVPAVRPALSARSHTAGTLAVFMLPALVAAAALVVLGGRRRK